MRQVNGWKDEASYPGRSRRRRESVVTTNGEKSAEAIVPVPTGRAEPKVEVNETYRK